MKLRAIALVGYTRFIVVKQKGLGIAPQFVDWCIVALITLEFGWHRFRRSAGFLLDRS
jgi:hypothetical protein